MPAQAVQYLDIRLIERDEALQARVEVNKSVAQEYAADLKNGALFPPVVVVFDGQKYWLVDGYHRTAARELSGHDNVLAEVRRGTREDAIWASVAANKAHGLRRSNADKHRCVERALMHPRAQRLSNRQIASHCGVHHFTVGRIRNELERKNAIDVVMTREVKRGGTTYAQKTAGISCSNRERHTSGGAAIAVASSRESESPRNARDATYGGGTYDGYANGSARQEVDRALGLLSEACTWLSNGMEGGETLLGPLRDRVRNLICEVERVRDEIGVGTATSGSVSRTCDY